jgi:hypothetical protein
LVHGIGRGAVQAFHQLADGGRDDHSSGGVSASLFDFTLLAFDNRGKAQYVVRR